MNESGSLSFPFDEKTFLALKRREDFTLKRKRKGKSLSFLSFPFLQREDCGSLSFPLREEKTFSFPFLSFLSLTLKDFPLKRKRKRKRL